MLLPSFMPEYFPYQTPQGQVDYLSMLTGFISDELADFKDGRPTDFRHLNKFAQILRDPLFTNTAPMKRNEIFPYEAFASALYQKDLRPIRDHEDVAFEISLFRLMLQNIRTLSPGDLENTIDSFKKLKKQIFYCAD